MLPTIDWQDDAIVALCSLGSDDAVHALGRALAAAVDDITVTRDPKSQPTVGGTYYLAWRLVYALGSTGNPFARDYLQEALNRGEKSQSIQRIAQEELAGLGKRNK